MEILIILWLLLPVVVGLAANGRGRSFAGWTLLSLVLTPLFALILLVVLPNVKEERAREARHGRELQWAVNAAAARPMPQPVPAGAAPESRLDPVATLTALADARDRGLITPQDYEAKKTELLGRV